MGDFSPQIVDVNFPTKRQFTDKLTFLGGNFPLPPPAMTPLVIGNCFYKFAGFSRNVFA